MKQKEWTYTVFSDEIDCFYVGCDKFTMFEYEKLEFGSWNGICYGFFNGSSNESFNGSEQTRIRPHSLAQWSQYFHSLTPCIACRRSIGHKSILDKTNTQHTFSEWERARTAHIRLSSNISYIQRYELKKRRKTAPKSNPCNQNSNYVSSVLYFGLKKEVISGGGVCRFFPFSGKRVSHCFFFRSKLRTKT